jgi:hypothetical protein
VVEPAPDRRHRADELGRRRRGDTGRPRGPVAVTPVPVQRSSAAPAWPGPTGSPVPGPSVGAGSSTVAAPVVSRLATAAPASPTSAATPSAGDVAVSTGIGHVAEDGSIVFDAPAGEPSFAGSADGGEGAAIQRSFGEGGGEGAGADGPAVVSGPPSLQLVGAGGGGGGAGGSDAELDELARKLYGRIRLHLRRELTLDRERSGSLIEMPR